MNKYRVDIQIGQFNYEPIEAETEEEAMEHAEDIVRRKYPWAHIERISATVVE